MKVVFAEPAFAIALVSRFVSLALAAGSWSSLPILAPDHFEDSDTDFFHYVNVSVGSQRHLQQLQVSLGDYISAISTTQCFFCPGADLFDPTQSTTFQPTNSSGVGAGVGASHDTLALGGVSSQNTPFIALDRYDTNSSGSKIIGGLLGVLVDGKNATRQDNSVLTSFSNNGAVLNPVIGIKFGPPGAKMTIGALDPNDYQGTLNWVPAVSTSAANIMIDGFVGFNGSLISYGSPLNATLTSVSKGLFVPSPALYFNNEGYTGRQITQIVQDVGSAPGTPEYSYICNGTDKQPTVSISVSINGVRYPVESRDLLRPQSSFAPPGTCHVAISNVTSTRASDETVLGLPFLRSVYLAYRFPTGDCPGYYGFAFPSGANRTADTIAQSPTSVLQGSDAQCVAFATQTNLPPATTPPTSSKGTHGGLSAGDTLFSVYGRPEDGQVPLVGVDALGSARIWNAGIPQ